MFITSHILFTKIMISAIGKENFQLVEKKKKTGVQTIGKNESLHIYGRATWDKYIWKQAFYLTKICQKHTFPLVICSFLPLNKALPM